MQEKEAPLVARFDYTLFHDQVVYQILMNSATLLVTAGCSDRRTFGHFNRDANMKEWKVFSRHHRHPRKRKHSHTTMPRTRRIVISIAIIINTVIVVTVKLMVEMLTKILLRMTTVV